MKRKKKISNKLKFPVKYFAIILVFFFLVSIIFINLGHFASAQKPTFENVAVKVESSQIMANGTVNSQNQVTLHFQTSGKLVYLPFKEGDRIGVGQTVAQLDPYPLQEQLTAALNTYRSTRDTFDQTKDNSDTGVSQGQQKFVLDTQNKSGIGGQGEINIINDMVKRIIDQNQANLDNSVINVELSNYALQLATLSSPINGVIYHEDVNVPNINISPTTSFVVADPDSLVFQAQVSDSDIDFIQVGSPTTIQLDSIKDKSISGTVAKIYPEKIKTSTGGSVYKVDIATNDPQDLTNIGATGTVFIKSKFDKQTILVPVWTVLDNHYIWVLQGNAPKLKTVITGNNYGQMIEILNGLSQDDRVIVNPESIVQPLYKIL